MVKQNTLAASQHSKDAAKDARSSDTAKRLKPLNAFFIEVAELTRFIGRFFKTVVTPPYEFKEISRQSFLVGNKSLALIAITGFIMGLVLTIQTRPTLA